MNNNLQDKVQKEAVKAWIEADKKGTLEVATGTGKTFMFLHCLYTMPKNDKMHLFLAEVTDREKDLLADIDKYNQIFGVNVLKDYNLKFRTYQAVYKLENYDFGLVCGDEIHFAMSPEYSKFFLNNNYDAIVGLSATVDRNTKYEDNGRIFTKGDILDSVAPVCFTYTISESKNDGIGRNLNVYIIHQELDAINLTVKAGNAKKSFFQTEKKAYDYWDKEHKKSWFIEDPELKDLKIRITSTKRSQLLYNLPSKIETVKQLLKNLKGKSILFGNSLDSLLKITPYTVSSRYSDDQNKKIREDFDTGKIDIIGSFKKLLQGANLKELDNCIIMSYFSSEKDVIQRFGRLRKNGDKVGSIFILLTLNTQEEKWFNSMMEDLKDFNIIQCKNLNDCINKYVENEGNS